MVFQLQFKTPDVTDQVDTEIEGVDTVLKQYLKYSEYITVEFDTELGTATVLKNC